MRIKPATLKIVSAVNCAKCQNTIVVPEEMREAARNGTLKDSSTVKQPAAGASEPAENPSGPASSAGSSAAAQVNAGRQPAAENTAHFAADRSGANPAVSPLKPNAELRAGGTVQKKTVVVSGKRKPGKKPDSPEPPANNGKPMRPKTIVAPPPLSAPVTVATAASDKGAKAVSSSTIKLIPTPEGVPVAAADKPRAVPPKAILSKPKAAPRPVRLTAAQPQAAAAANAPVVNKALKDIAALEVRIAALEAADFESRLAELEKRIAAMTSGQQGTAADPAGVVDKLESLKAAVAKIDKRLDGLLQAQLQQAQSLSGDLAKI